MSRWIDPVHGALDMVATLMDVFTDRINALEAAQAKTARDLAELVRKLEPRLNLPRCVCCESSSVPLVEPPGVKAMLCYRCVEAVQALVGRRRAD